MPTRLRDELPALTGLHRGKIVDVELAVSAEAALRIAGHVAPFFRAGLCDRERRGFCFHPVTLMHRSGTVEVLSDLAPAMGVIHFVSKKA